MDTKGLPNDVFIMSEPQLRVALSSAWRQAAVGQKPRGSMCGSEWEEVIEGVACTVSYFFSCEVDDSNIGKGPSEVSAYCEVKIMLNSQYEIDPIEPDEKGFFTEKEQLRMKEQCEESNSLVVTYAEHSIKKVFEDDGSDCIPDAADLLSKAVIDAKVKLRFHPIFLSQVEKIEMHDNLAGKGVFKPSRSL